MVIELRYPGSIPIHGKIDMPDYKIKTLAYLIAEGTLGKSTPLFTNSDDNVINEFAECIFQFPDIEFNLNSQRGKTRTYRISKTDDSGYHNSLSSVAQWLNDIGILYHKSATKFVPDCIFTLPNNKIALFLNRLISCDGWCSKSQAKIQYYSISERLCRDVQHLLLRFGIISCLYPKHGKVNGSEYLSYVVAISDNDSLVKFSESINIKGKEDIVRSVIGLLASRHRYSTIDTIPMLGRKTIHGKSIKDYISRNRLKALEPDNPMLQTHILWDEVVSIRQVGIRHVYDLSMPNRTFVAADFIVHNTSLAIQFAAVQHRPIVIADFGTIQEPQQLFQTTHLIQGQGSFNVTETRESAFIRGIETPNCTVVMDEFNLG